MPAPSPYPELRRLLREVAVLNSLSSLLNWDQETYMPPAAIHARAEQSERLAALIHERRTSPRLGELIAACEADRSLTADPDAPDAANIREARRDFDLATKLPTALVAELARTGAEAQHAWKEAREKSDFAAFAPWLEKMMGLARRKAECYGTPPGGEPYDALLNEYEPGATAREIEAVFTPLSSRLSRLIAELLDGGTPPSDEPLRAAVPAARQHEFGQFVLRAMGFDFAAGRLDTTTHPFCSGLGPGDTRLTTRYREQSFTDALYGTMHEGGHGLYEQGLPKADPPGAEPGSGLFGLPLSEAVSLGVHESQSRMWENFVGRSREFWRWALPYARLLFAPALDRSGPDDLYRAVNTARPSLIRVEADEATYNLHIMLRFDVERALLAGSLAVRDVPGAWNEGVKKRLGIDVPDDRRGCLQDVHWSFGLVGYFPTYTLGNLYAAQFWETINAQVPDLPAMMARGEFLPLRDWLRSNIHRHGRRYRAADLCKRVTGKPLSADPLMRHLEGKLRAVYGLG